MKARLWGGLATVVVLGGLGWGWVAYREHQAREASIESLVSSADIELHRDKIDRSSVMPLLRALVRHEAGHSDPRLLRARARLLQALDRVDEAWKVARKLIVGRQASADDLLLAARLRIAQHGLRGDERDGSDALGLAMRSYDATGAVEPLFLAWQCARRTGDHSEIERIDELMAERFADTPQGRLVAALESQEPPTLAVLRKLELEFEDVPEELHAAIALALLQQQTPEASAEAVSHVRAVLQLDPSSVDARHLAVVAYQATKDFERRDAHLDWLLKNAPADDQRQALWARLKAGATVRHQ